MPGLIFLPLKMNEMNSRPLRYECVRSGDKLIPETPLISEMNKFDIWNQES